MKKAWIVWVMIVVALLVFGCSSTYTVRTKDGKEFISEGEPDVTDDNFIKFKTTGGRKVLLKQDEVSTIEEN